MRRLLGSLAATALLLAAGCGDDGGGGTGSSASEVLGDADEGIDGVQAIRVADNLHFEGDIDYDLSPPAGGEHNPVWWNCGFYDAPIPDENAVHDLEHGAVWLAYSPDLDAADVEVIHNLVRASDKVLAAPYEGLGPGEAVVATAWARQLRLDSVDDPRLEAFVVQYVSGSQAPEGGATCMGTNLGMPIP
jgi:hypothetical protein